MKLIILSILAVVFMTIFTAFYLQGKNILEIAYRSVVNYSPSDPLVSLGIYSMLIVAAVAFIFAFSARSR